MGTNTNSKTRKGKTNYLSQIVVVSLLLFVLALFVNISYHSYVWSQHVKSMQYLRIEMTNEASFENIRAQLTQHKMIRSVDFISKDKGLELLKSNTHTDPTALLDKNPLPNIINAFLVAETTPLEIDKEIDQIKIIEGIAAVDYKRSDAKLLDRIIDKISWVMLILVALLLIASVFIIDSTVRLAFYSKRMTIRSMQLIGATRGFIRKPYILRAILNGTLSGFIATLGIAIIYASLEYYYPELQLLKNLTMLLSISGAVVIIGIVFTLTSTYFSIGKYLRMNLDDLY
jgi:cell division transport system permease protein